MRRIILAAVFFVATAAFGAEAPRTAKSYFVYVGTYTEEGSESKGIYVYRFDPGSGKTVPLGLAAAATNPSFLAVHPNHRFLYAVNEVSNYKGEKSGGVSAFAIDRMTGKLKLLNQVASKGGDPCYISLDKSGKFVLVANYAGGSVSVFPVQADGRLGEASGFVQHSGHGTDAKRQEAPHAHSIDVSPDNRFAMVDDLGLDETRAYGFDGAKGTLTTKDGNAAKAADGAGPRHFVFHPNGKFGYVLDEMGNTVSAFSFEAATGELKALQTVSSLPPGFAGHSEAAEIVVDRAGKFLYASNRGQDGIAVFAIDGNRGTLTPVEYDATKGASPRAFEISPDGGLLFAANEKSDNIVLFRVNRQTGRLTPTGKVLDLAQPVCVKFVPAD